MSSLSTAFPLLLQNPDLLLDELDLGKSWIGLDELLPILQAGFGIIFPMQHRDAHVEKRARIIGIQLQRLLELGNRVIEAILIEHGRREVRTDTRVTRTQFHCFSVKADRLLEILLFEVDVAKLHKCLNVLRIILDLRLELLD